MEPDIREAANRYRILNEELEEHMYFLEDTNPRCGNSYFYHNRKAEELMSEIDLILDHWSELTGSDRGIGVSR